MRQKSKKNQYDIKLSGSRKVRDKERIKKLQN